MYPNNIIVQKVNIIADWYINWSVEKATPKINGSIGINPNRTNEVNVTNAPLICDSALIIIPYFSPNIISTKAF